MIPIAKIRANANEIAKKLEIKGNGYTQIIQDILASDTKKREIQTQANALKSESNQLAKQIGGLFKDKKIEEANKLKAKTAILKEAIKTLDESLFKESDRLKNLLLSVPNVPHQSVPAGKSDADNVVLSEHGAMPTLMKGAKPHWELAKAYNLIDFELGVKITGAGFPVYKGKGAALQRALITFFITEAVKLGYEEVIPPIFVNEASGFGTGNLPDKEGQMYYMPLDNLYVIPTAEIPITNLYRGNILTENDFPIRNVGYTPCFRREAGSYGKDVRGLNRLHQFDKVEIVHVEHPVKSYETLETMQKYVQGLLQKLGLPYRVLRLCAGDLSFASALTYDMEVFSAAQDKWLEVSSISNFEDFQANRLGLRFKNKEGKMQFCHTLNGSALALPRIVAALLENNQTEEGIKIPACLQPFTGFSIITK